MLRKIALLRLPTKRWSTHKMYPPWQRTIVPTNTMVRTSLALLALPLETLLVVTLWCRGGVLPCSSRCEMSLPCRNRCRNVSRRRSPPFQRQSGSTLKKKPRKRTRIRPTLDRVATALRWYSKRTPEKMRRTRSPFSVCPQWAP